MSLFGDVDPETYMDEFRAETERIRRMFENSVPPPRPGLFSAWLKSLRDYFAKDINP